MAFEFRERIRFVTGGILAAATRSALLFSLCALSVGQTPAAAQGNLIDMIINGSRILEGAPRRSVEPYPHRREIPDSGDLMQAQARLKELGYDVGTPDGRSGPRTRAAIRRYQSDRGDRATGILTPQQMSELTGGGRPAEEPLRRDEMADMQRGLATLGFDVGAVDGVAGGRTGRAVARFLSDRGLDPNQTPVRTAYRMVLDEASRQWPRVPGAAPAGEALEVVQAPAVSTAAPRSATPDESRFGLPSFDGEPIVYGEGQSIGRRLTGESRSGAKMLDLAMYRLRLLLHLKGDPAFLEQATQAFIPFIAPAPAPDFTPYIQETFTGANQFETEDNRQRFLVEHRDAIMQMVPDLPLVVRQVTSGSLGTYDVARGVLAVDLGGGKSALEGDVSGISAPMPYRSPGEWALSAEDARRIIEAAQASSRRRDPQGAAAFGASKGVTVVHRYVVRDARPGARGTVALDLAALDIKVYDGFDLQTQLGEIPLPQNAIKAAGDTPVAATTTPLFDPLLVRMLALKHDAALAGSEGFMATSFELRRREERAYLDRPGANLNFERFIPAPLLRDDRARPTPADRDRMAQWLSTNTPRIGDKVKFERNLIWVHSNNRLSGIAGGSGNTPSREDQALIRDKFPDSVDFGYLRSGDDITVLYGLHPSAHWNDESILAGYNSSGEANAQIIVRIAESELRDIGGHKYLMLDLVPDSVVVTTPGGSGDKVIPLPDAAPSSTVAQGDGSVPGSRFEVLGIKLGMPLEDARRILQATMAEGTPLSADPRIDYGSMTPCQSLEIRLRGNSLTPEQLGQEYAARDCPMPGSGPLEFGFGLDIQHSKTLSERIVLLHSGTSTPTPVVSAIYRVFSGDIGDAFEKGLVATYGPDYVVDGSYGNGRIWADNPIQSARFSDKGDERCAPGWVGARFTPPAELDCGAYLRGEPTRMVLIDTKFVVRVEEALKLARSDADKKPQVKF